MSPELRGPGRLAGQRSLLGRFIGALVTIGALVVGLMFSVVVFGVALVLGLAIWGWLWWKMRRVMREAQNDPRFQQFRDAANPATPPSADSTIIEGEVLREEWKDGGGPRP